MKGVRRGAMMRGMARKKGQARGAKREQFYEAATPSGVKWLTEEEFEAELFRRVEEVESGKVKTIPLDVVMRRLRGGH